MCGQQHLPTLCGHVEVTVVGLCWLGKLQKLPLSINGQDIMIGPLILTLIP
jgi:hypothetical protein